MDNKNKFKSVLAALAIAVVASTLNIRPAQACTSEPYIGVMCVFAGNFAPRGFALAQGQLLAISQNTALFSLLGTTYGGDGRTTFALPDTRGRALIGAGSGPGLSTYRLGQNGGVETVTLTVNQMPSHNHGATTTATGTATANAASVSNTDNPSGSVWARLGRTDVYSSSAPDVTMSSAAISLAVSANTTIANAGGSQSHENRMPYLAVNWIIALQGLFPSRS